MTSGYFGSKSESSRYNLQLATKKRTSEWDIGKATGYVVRRHFPGKQLSAENRASSDAVLRMALVLKNQQQRSPMDNGPRQDAFQSCMFFSSTLPCL